MQLTEKVAVDKGRTWYRQWPRLVNMRQIAQVSPELGDVLGRVKRILEGLYGSRLRGVYLYGSCARGDQTEDESDIDVAVILDDFENVFDELDRIVGAIHGLCLDRGVLISCRAIREQEYAVGRESLHRSIRRQGIPI